MTFKTTFFLILLISFYGMALFAQDAEVDPNGYLFGDVYLNEGAHYRGIIRWGKEESSWGDLFHSSKGEVPFIAYIPEECKKERNIKVFGIKIPTQSWAVQVERIFVARFGDIREIRVKGREKADVLMKSGRVYSVEGYSNDVGTNITVADESLGTVTVPWNKVEKVVFSNGKLAPGNFPQRIYGRADTDSGSFEGFIQWDHDECTGEDELDGENENGSFSIPFKKIASIRRVSNSTSSLKLTDGRELDLRGTNDVNKGNRGIYVDDIRFGRVDISWGVLKQVTFSWGRDTGPTYDEYAAGSAMQVQATDRNGKTHTGFMAFDLDEMESWEFLNGSVDEIEYFIPFSSISSIEPQGSYRSQIVLTSEKTILLEEKADVSDKNLGILVLKNPEDTKGDYIPWKDLEKLTIQ